MNHLQTVGPSQVSAEWVLHLLLRRGVLTPADVLLASPTVEETSMSHSCFCVRVAGEPTWYFKRADPVRSQGRDLGVEAIVYRLAVSTPELKEVMPRCRLIGERDNALLLDAVCGKPLSSFFNSISAPLTAPSPSILRAYGDAVARIHSVRPPHFGTAPWLLDALEPRWGDYGWLPKPCAAFFLRLATSPTFQLAFRKAQRGWKPVSLIHGDLRWSNALVDDRSEPGRVWLIDWELACIGDPAWDLGSVLADVAVAAALADRSYPPTTDPLDSASWILKAYASRSEVSFPVWTHLVERSLHLAGVRLVQTIVEYGYGSEQELARAETALIPWATWFFTNSAAFARELAGTTAEG